MARKKNLFAYFFLTALLSFSPSLFSQEPAPSYDRYAPVYRQTGSGSTAGEIAANFLTYPFEIIRWPVSKTLVLIEKHHIDTKAQWAYDQLLNRGIQPYVGFLSTGGWGHYGLDLDLVRLTDQKMRYPDLKANTSIHYADDIYFKVGAEAGWHDMTNTGLGAMGIFDYEDRPEEHFHGIGPDTSAGDGTSFAMETTTLGTKLIYQRTPVWETNATFKYRNINITDGEDGGRGIIDRIFPAGSIPGLAGDEILSAGLEIVHDTRNHRELSTQGGYRRLGASFNEGVAGSDARYFTYDAEAVQYIRLGSDRRVLTLRARGEHNDEVNNGTVPFHQMAKLGGAGVWPRLSETLRSYDYNRFFDESLILFNIEYRYAIWEYRDFRMDAVLFWDEGQVFGEFSDFQMKDFRESYGVGFRVSVANHVLLNIEAAHGDEGTNVYVKTRTPF